MSRFRTWLAAISVAGIAIAIPAGVVYLQGSGQRTPAPVFTPVQLADGLAFNQGTAAPYLAVFQRPGTPVTGRLRTVQHMVDAALRADPRMARRFAADVQSGRATRVADGLRLLGRLTRAAFRDEFGQNGDRQLIAWTREAPTRVSIAAAVSDPEYGYGCSTCAQNPPTANPPPPPVIIPPTYCLICIINPPPPVPAPPPAPPHVPLPTTCSQCVINTPTAGGNGQVEEAVPAGVALSLPSLMAGTSGAARADRKAAAETIAVVAFTLDAD